MKHYKAIGLMSGTSCDGLDIAYCEFLLEGERWEYRIIETSTVVYSEGLTNKLVTAIQFSDSELTQLDRELGIYFGQEVQKFIEQKGITEVNFIASHGHTIFHQPERGVTLQIGSGEEIKNIVQLPVINDFRSLDVKNGGQGAPLVPIGDKLLFSEYQYCVNIGGIANVSYEENGLRKAYDCCFANMILNPLAQELGKPFDENGEIAKKGNLNVQLLDELMKLNFNKKSLGYEGYQAHVLPILNRYLIPTQAKIATVTHYLAFSIAKIFKPNSSVLITGGGAFNVFLMELINKNTQANIITANKQLVEYKEALIFAFLGVLRMENTPNCLASVTGANSDSVGGVLINVN